MAIETTFICEKCGSTSYEQFSQTQVECKQCKQISFFDTGYSVMPSMEIQEPSNTSIKEEKSKISNTSLGKRIVNYLLDSFAISSIFNLISLLLPIPVENNFLELYMQGKINKIEDFTIPLLLMACIVIYYMLLEYAFGKTLGKFITKTKVISNTDKPLSLLQCLIRALCRLIPFEGISGLFSGGIFWHDSISKTSVVDDNP